jgi:DNA-binding transcriptional ArsR family regulator
VVSPNRLAEVAAVIGDPARAAMLTALMDGRALTATELAHIAGVTPQTASTHLTRMIGTELVAMERQGRHRYHRLASSAVAGMLECLMLHASGRLANAPALRTGPRNDAMRLARTCYDHIAGKLGVAIAEAAVERRYVELCNDTAVLTRRGTEAFASAGILHLDLTTTSHSRRPHCRICLDWSERRPHLAGRLGAAICTYALDHGWLRRTENSRALAITPKGRKAFADVLGARID